MIHLVRLGSFKNTLQNRVTTDAVICYHLVGKSLSNSVCLDRVCDCHLDMI